MQRYQRAISHAPRLSLSHCEANVKVIISSFDASTLSHANSQVVYSWLSLQAAHTGLQYLRGSHIMADT